MSEQDQVKEQQNDPQEIDYKAWYEENLPKVQSFESIVSKKEELLKETKAAKEKERKAAEQAEQARKEQQMIAEKNGEYEKLYKQKDEEVNKLKQELLNDRQERRNEKINVAAIKLASDLAKGESYKAELLSEFIAKKIGSIADEYGRVDNDTLEDIKKQFETDEKYAPLLGGNKSTGGGAPGNTRGAQQKTQLTQAEFKVLAPAKQMEVLNKIKSGELEII